MIQRRSSACSQSPPCLKETHEVVPVGVGAGGAAQAGEQLAEERGVVL